MPETPPVRRFDASALIEEINERTGAGLRLQAMAEQGESGGAAFVSWPDGRQAVVTRRPEPLETVRATGEGLKNLDLPVPRYEAVVDLADGVAVVQERLPGHPAEHIDVAVLDAMVEMNERFTGLLADRPDIGTPKLYLAQSGPAFYRHETLAQHSFRSRRLLERIEEIGASEPNELTETDLLHADYTLGNVLFKSGEISGIEDRGLLRGDRRFALVGLRFDLAWTAFDQNGPVTVDPVGHPSPG